MSAGNPDQNVYVYAVFSSLSDEILDFYTPPSSVTNPVDFWWQIFFHISQENMA